MLVTTECEYCHYVKVQENASAGRERYRCPQCQRVQETVSVEVSEELPDGMTIKQLELVANAPPEGA